MKTATQILLFLCLLVVLTLVAESQRVIVRGNRGRTVVVRNRNRGALRVIGGRGLVGGRRLIGGRGLRVVGGGLGLLGRRRFGNLVVGGGRRFLGGNLLARRTVVLSGANVVGLGGGLVSPAIGGASVIGGGVIGGANLIGGGVPVIGGANLCLE